MTQDHARLEKAVLCIYAITSSTIEKGLTQKGEESLFNCFSFYCCCKLKYARKRHFSLVLNVPLCDSFFSILLISFQFELCTPVQFKGLSFLIG